MRTDNYNLVSNYDRADWFDAIGNYGGMQAFIALIVVVFFNHMTEIDFMTSMLKHLFLKRMPAHEFLDKYGFKNHHTSSKESQDFHRNLNESRNRVEKHLEETGVVDA